MPINQRQSQSSQNPGPGGTVPQNQMVPQAAGNPRYKPGIGPDPNPRVVVKAVNPPITPDQVVPMAEIPEAATIELPKIQNIKIAPVKNKTIQGHLKAIEAKMVATEKLMKDVVKLQKVQIHTEKELFERKRELYQNTFEEYLLDKTIDFEDPENPDCTCVNLPKKGGPGGGFLPNRRRRRRGRGRNRQPSTAPAPSTAKEPATQKGPATVPGTTPPLQPNLPKEEEESPQKYPEGYPAPNPIDLIKIFGDFKRFWDLITDPGLGPVTAIPQSSPLAFNRDPGLEEFLRSGEFDPVSQAAAPAITPEEATRQLNEEIDGQQSDYGGTFTPIKKQPLSPDPVAVNPLQTMLDGFTNPKSLAEVTGLPISEDLEMALETVMQLQTGAGALQVGAAKAPAIAQTVKRLGVPFVSRVPGLKRLFGLSDDVAEITVKAGKAGTGAADDVAATTTAVPKTNVTPAARPVRRPSSGGERTGRNLGRRGSNRRNLEQRRLDRTVEQLDSQPTPSNVQSQMNRTSLEASLKKTPTEQIIEQGSRVISKKRGQTLIQRGNLNAEERMLVEGVKKIDIPKKASGGMGDVELFNSDALNYFRGMSSKIVPQADGGLVGWWNKGRNVRIPNENTARFGDIRQYRPGAKIDKSTLFGDDVSQVTRSNKAFKSGATGYKGWNPLKAFTPDMVRTGPTPAIRQIVERPVRTVTHPLMMALEFIVNDLLINPRSTAVYDQVTGPNAYYNDPAYKGPMPSQNLENAQSSMMSGNTDQKPQVVPLPPDYIKIPGKKIAPNYVGTESPDIKMKSSVFTRSSSHID